VNVTEQAFTIAEFATAYKIGRTTLFEEIKAGRLKTYKVGRRRLISLHAGQDWQRSLEQRPGVSEKAAA
jgi:excisionase family DNA binding protein